MYIPAHFAEQNTEALRTLIKAYPLGTWVVPDEIGLTINHVPFLLDTDHNQLLGHVARANPVWKATNKTAAVVFQGPQGYISPSWYPSKHEHHRAVPTWNYAVAHVHGTFEVIQDREWLLSHITQLSNEHEANQIQPWHISHSPHEYIDKMVSAIVGIRVHIERIEGKFKLSQNRSKADLLGVLAGLNASQSNNKASLAAFMQTPNPQS